MNKFFIALIFTIISSISYGVCTDSKRQVEAINIASKFASSRGVKGSIQYKVKKTTFVSARNEVEYNVEVKIGHELGKENYLVLIDQKCLPTSIMLSDGLE